jgi:hypothetical protein
MLPEEVLAEAFKRRSSARRSIAHEAKPALQSRARLTLLRPPHSMPNVRDVRDTPLLAGRNGRSCTADLGAARSGIFLISRLDTISENQK